MGAGSSTLVQSVVAGDREQVMRQLELNPSLEVRTIYCVFDFAHGAGVDDRGKGPDAPHSDGQIRNVDPR